MIIYGFYNNAFNLLILILSMLANSLRLYCNLRRRRHLTCMSLKIMVLLQYDSNRCIGEPQRNKYISSSIPFHSLSFRPTSLSLILRLSLLHHYVHVMVILTLADSTSSAVGVEYGEVGPKLVV